MKKPFNKEALARIVDSDYPTEAKVAEIMALHKQSRVELLNRISNQVNHVIDVNQYN